MDKLRTWMAEQNMNQAELARRLDVSEATVSLVLNGKREHIEGFAWRFLRTFGFTATATIFGLDAAEVIEDTLNIAEAEAA